MKRLLEYRIFPGQKALQYLQDKGGQRLEARGCIGRLRCGVASVGVVFSSTVNPPAPSRPRASYDCILAWTVDLQWEAWEWGGRIGTCLTGP
jgi:hypothetical protein